jgi:signal peptidase
MTLSTPPLAGRAVNHFIYSILMLTQKQDNDEVKKMNYQKTRRIMKISLLVMLCAILLVNLYIITARVVFKKDLPKVFGFAQIIVISGSMEPAIKVGDLLIIHEQDSYKVKDMVTFRQDKRFVTHRIIELRNDEVVTQGDVNNVPDEPIKLFQVEGKVFLRIPRVGDFILFLKTPFGILMLSLAAILLIEIPYIIDRRKSVKE